MDVSMEICNAESTDVKSIVDKSTLITLFTTNKQPEQSTRMGQEIGLTVKKEKKCNSS